LDFPDPSTEILDFLDPLWTIDKIPPSLDFDGIALKNCSASVQQENI